MIFDGPVLYSAAASGAIVDPKKSSFMHPTDYKGDIKSTKHVLGKCFFVHRIEQITKKHVHD